MMVQNITLKVDSGQNNFAYFHISLSKMQIEDSIEIVRENFRSGKSKSWLITMVVCKM